MKRTLISIVSMATIILMIAARPGRSSSGAPASHTGAPGEKTCAVSGCHDDNKINVGSASLDISLIENVKKIEAGKTYHIKVRITDENVSRFGFQLVALESKTSINQGIFRIMDSLRTQKTVNTKNLKDRNYITYTFDGTDAVSNGVGEWIVEWTAPEKINKPITFYAAAVSANDDMSDKGDKVYTKSLTLKNQ